MITLWIAPAPVCSRGFNQIQCDQIWQNIAALAIFLNVIVNF